MKKRKYLLIALTLILATILASIPMPTVKALEEVTMVFRYDGPGYYLPQTRTLWVIVDIYAPEAWDNSRDGIVGWSFDVHVDPSVLEPVGAYGATFDYYLYDFADYWGYTGNYPSLLVGSIDKPAGNMINIAEYLMGWETLGVGAGGSSDPVTGWYGLGYGMVRLRFKPLQPGVPGEYSPIEITNAFYYTPAGKFPVTVEVGHYCPPPAPEFPLGAVAPLALIAAVVYVWRVRKRKPLEVL